MSAGGSRSKQSSMQQSLSQAFGRGYSVSGQDVWGGQAPALQALYGEAGELLNRPSAVAAPAQAAWAAMLQPGVNPYFSQSLNAAVDAATRGFTQGVLPALSAQAVGAGAFGEPRDRLAQGQAAGEFGQSLTNMVAQMSARQYEADQSRALGALGLAPQMGGLDLQNILAASQIVGGPTVLGRSQAENWNQAMSSSYDTGSGRSSSFQAGIK